MIEEDPWYWRHPFSATFLVVAANLIVWGTVIAGAVWVVKRVW